MRTQRIILHIQHIGGGTDLVDTIDYLAKYYHKLALQQKNWSYLTGTQTATSMTLEIEGPLVWALLKGETGYHTFKGQVGQRVHTASALVTVIHYPKRKIRMYKI